MPSLAARISEAIAERIKELVVEWPLASWATIGQTNDHAKQDLVVDGREFLYVSLKNYVRQRDSPAPVGSYDVVQDAVFSAKTFARLMERTPLDLHPNGSRYKSFLLFVGVALGQVGEAALTTWFAATFGPVVSAAEAAFVDYYRSPASSSTRQEGQPSKRSKTTRGDRRATQPHAHHRSMPAQVRRNRVPPQPRGLVSTLVSSVSSFFTESIPTFLADSLFSPELVVLPSVAMFAPSLNFVPARLPVPPPDPTTLFAQIHETYDLLEAIYRLEEAAPLPLCGFASTSAAFALPHGANLSRN